MRIQSPIARHGALFAALFLFLHPITAFPLSKPYADHLDPRGLFKRSCVVGPETNSLPFCETLSVGAIQTAITEYWGEQGLNGNVCLFYLGLGGSQGVILSEQWYCSMVENAPDPITWNDCLPQSYMSVAKSSTASITNAPSIDGSGTMTGKEIWNRLHSQAFAESCQGDVYFFTPTGQDPSVPAGNIWWNYEYPALTRNDRVNRIIQVDPTLKDDEGNYADEGTPIWVYPQAPSALAPAGSDYSITLPAILIA